MEFEFLFITDNLIILRIILIVLEKSSSLIIKEMIFKVSQFYPHGKFCRPRGAFFRIWNSLNSSVLFASVQLASAAMIPLKSVIVCIYKLIFYFSWWLFLLNLFVPHLSIPMHLLCRSLDNLHTWTVSLLINFFF